MSSYGNTIKSDTFVGNDVYVDTLHWKTFDPPLSGGGAVPTLAAVLDTGDDANAESITNLNDLECVSVTASGDVSANNVVVTTKATANQFEGSGVNPSITGINNISTNNITVVNELNATTTAITCNSLNATTNISAVTASIPTITATDVNTQDLQNPGGTVKVTGLQARSDINLEDDASPPVRHNINNVNTLNATAVDTTAVSSLQSSIAVMTGNNLTLNGNATEFTGQLNMNVLASGGTSKIDFTGLTGVSTIDTFLEGDKRLVGGIPIRTKASYLDFSDGTNVIPTSVNDYYWGVHYSPTPRVTKDFDDTALDVFNENCYFIFSSTISNHQELIFDLTFFIEEYGYGDITLSIMYQRDDGTGSRVELPGSRMFYVPEESATAFRSVRKVGQCHAQWLMTNVPTDGLEYRFYPAARTNYTDNGRMIISMYVNGGDPNDPAQRGAPVIFQARPVPRSFRFVT
jgi:hypothetical protein